MNQRNAIGGVGVLEVMRTTKDEVRAARRQQTRIDTCYNCTVVSVHPFCSAALLEKNYRFLRMSPAASDWNVDISYHTARKRRYTWSLDSQHHCVIADAPHGCCRHLEWSLLTPSCYLSTCIMSRWEE